MFVDIFYVEQIFICCYADIFMGLILNAINNDEFNKTLSFSTLLSFQVDREFKFFLTVRKVFKGIRAIKIIHALKELNSITFHINAYL